MVELKFIKQCPLRYGVVATSLRAGVNKREQQLYQEYLTRLRLKDRKPLHTPDGEVGPLERGFTSTTNQEDFKPWVVGFHHEWSDELAKLPETLANVQVARWQSKYGRGPTDQQRSWLTIEQDTNGHTSSHVGDQAQRPLQVIILKELERSC
jgi:hypothetical protein